jgi:hypothetical protein
MKNQSILKYLVYLFTCVFTLYNVVDIKTSTELDLFGNELTYLVPDSIVYAGFGLILVFVFIILKSEYWKSAFAIVLLAATFNLIQFSPRTSTFMGVETTYVLLLFFHLGLNSEIFNPVKKILKKVLVLKEGANELNESLINKFEKKYADKTIEELSHISESKQYSLEAIEAALRVLIKTGYNKK